MVELLPLTLHPFFFDPLFSFFFFVGGGGGGGGGGEGLACMKVIISSKK